jgi:SAM-dependent methyltransferase
MMAKRSKPHLDPAYWDGLYRDNPNRVIVVDHVLADETAGLEPGSALDLGCGPGGNAIWLARRGWQVVGVDWAERAIELAREAAAAAGVAAEFVLADVTDWRAPRRFDLVISTFSLLGGELSRRALATAAAALAAGGTVIVAEWHASMGEVWDFADDELYTPQQVAEMLGDLQVERAEVVRVEAFNAGDDPRAAHGTWANAVLVRARRPLGEGA